MLCNNGFAELFHRKSEELTGQHYSVLFQEGVTPSLQAIEGFLHLRERKEIEAKDRISFEDQ